MSVDDPLTEVERDAVVAELGAAYSRSQQNYEESIRVIAAGAVAITASLITALKVVGWSGGFAMGLSLLALGVNLASFGAAQRAILWRRARAWELDRGAVIEGGRWTKFTTYLNVTAGLLLVAAGVSLIVYLDSHT